MTYEYECSVCGAVHEVEHGMSENPAVTCSCRSDRPLCKRIISRSTFVLSGNCWAKDGYTRQNKKDVE